MDLAFFFVMLSRILRSRGLMYICLSPHLDLRVLHANEKGHMTSLGASHRVLSVLDAYRIELSPHLALLPPYPFPCKSTRRELCSRKRLILSDFVESGARAVLYWASRSRQYSLIICSFRLLLIKMNETSNV